MTLKIIRSIRSIRVRLNTFRVIRLIRVQKILILKFLIMSKTDFSEIDRLHSEWSRMEKAARLGWLSGEKARLTGLANQFSLYIYAKGGLINDSERAYARKLLDMINSVDAEGSKVMDDLRNDAFKEIVKSIMKQ